MATLTKTKKVAENHPPRDIRENTKARRAWLADELARINAEGNGRSGKIVGMGSYQYVSVYQSTETEGRERFRGVCQCCGRPQVVDARGLLVLHGYNRPGWGTVVGECPGRGELSLNVSNVLTTAWHKQATQDAADAAAAYEAAKLATRAASAALNIAGESIYDAHQSKPRSPDRRHMAHWPTADVTVALAKYSTQRAEWAARFPAYAAYVAAQAAESEARDTEWKHRQARDHFATLLAGGTYGSPLTREVVA